MLPKELETYLADCKTKQLGFEQIKDNLAASGWSLDQIEQARIWYEKPDEELTIEEVPDSVLPSETIQPASAVLPGNMKTIAVMGGGFVGFVLLIFLIISLLPKSPSYVFARWLETCKKTKSYSFDASLETTSKILTSLLSSNDFSLKIKGNVDMPQQNNPDVSMTLSVGNDISVDMIKKGNGFYYKINKVPFFATMMMGLTSDQVDVLVKDWISQDIKQYTSAETLKKIDQTKLKKIQEYLLSQTKIKKEKNIYVLSLSVDEKTYGTIQSIYDSSSQTKKTGVFTSFPKVYIEMRVDSKTYLLSSIDITAKTEIQASNMAAVEAYIPSSVFSPTIQKESMTVTSKTTFSDYGKKVEIKAPKKSISTDEFMKLLSESLKKSIVSTFSEEELSKQTILELQNALVRYQTMHTAYPAELSVLVKANEIKQSFIKEAETRKVYYLVNEKLDQAFVYTLTKDTKTPKAPYRAVMLDKTAKGSVKSYSSKEINGMITALGY